jgi:hypothetical protein
MAVEGPVTEVPGAGARHQQLLGPGVGEADDLRFRVGGDPDPGLHHDAEPVPETAAVPTSSMVIPSASVT